MGRRLAPSPVTVIVPCGAAKIWDKRPLVGPVPAGVAYISSYFKVNRQYAEAFGDRWFILSAKHGLISPRYIISRNYNASFKVDSPDWPGCIKDEVLQEQAQMLWTGPGERIIVLGGKDYVQAARAAFKKLPLTKLDTPFLGLSMLKQMREVKRSIEAGDWRRQEEVVSGS